jgi:pimeloyl-ACP methyl ester carboxylesterase
MKNILIILCYCTLLMPTTLCAQNFWGTHSQKISLKAYEGHRFRVQTYIKTDIDDDSAAARIFYRVQKGENAYFIFNNSWDSPIRHKEWQKYTFEDTLKTGCDTLGFGMLCAYNGKFYFDDVTIDIETENGVWKNVFNADFENGQNSFINGSSYQNRGLNNLYTANIINNQAASGTKCLVIEGKNVPNYGVNNKVGKFADVNRIKLYYEIYGEGQPLLVLHGNGGSIDNATTHYPELIKKYKVIAIDNRGQGRSTDTDKPMTYDLMASDIKLLLDQLGIDSVYIWGQSDGAILGLLLAMDYPKKVKKVLAFGANIQPDSNAIFSYAINSDAKNIKTETDEKKRKLLILMRDYPNFPFSKLGQIKAQVLIMAGDRDVIRPEHTLKLFQHIPNAQMCIIPGSTHGAAWEKQALFMQLLNDFFEKPFEMPTTEDWYKE